MNVSEILGFEPASLWIPTAVAQRSDVQSLAKAVSDIAVSDMAAGASVAILQENGASEADANQVTQEAISKEPTGNLNPDADRLSKSTKAAETSAGDINPQA